MNKWGYHSGAVAIYRVFSGKKRSKFNRPRTWGLSSVRMSTNLILDKRKRMKMYDKGFAQSGHTIANRTYSQRPTDTPPNAQFPPRPKSSHSPYSLSKPIDSIHPCALERTLSKMMSPIIKLFYIYVAFSKVMIASGRGPSFILSWSGSTEPLSGFISLGRKTPKPNSVPVVFIEMGTRENCNMSGTYF